ncbi:MAG: regulatory protein RecX [Lentisphaerae bacterium]|nr:regulatory protein RecX [Lentisphaerota bacterium]
MPKEPPSALVKAMNFLAQRSLSEMELLNKLRRAGYPDNECDEAIAECIKRHYLDDEQLTADCVDILHQRNLGARQIKMKLSRRGLDLEKVNELLEQSPDEEIESARRAMETKLRSLIRETDPRKKREKIFRFMVGRGFSPALIFKLLSESGNDCQTSDITD